VKKRKETLVLVSSKNFCDRLGSTAKGSEDFLGVPASSVGMGKPL